MAIRTTHKISLAIGSAAILAVVLAVIGAFAADRLRSDAAWVSHTHAVRGELADVSRNIDAAKADIRGFLLTRDSSYLARHERNIEATEAAYRRLTSLVADDASQSARLATVRPLLTEREAAFQQTIRLGTRAGVSPSEIANRLALGESLSARIDSVLVAAEAEEESLLASRTARETSTGRVLSTLALSFVAVTVLLVFLLWRSIGRDLSGRGRAEEELRASEAKFAGILDIAVDAIVTVDAEQRIVHFNRGAEAIFGHHRDEVIGRPLEELLPLRSRRNHAGHVRGFAESPEQSRPMGERRQIYGRRKNGDEFPAEASISKLRTPSGWLFTAVLRDVSERRRQEESEHAQLTASAALATTLDFERTVSAVAALPVPSVGAWSVLDVVESEDSGTPTLRRVAGTHVNPDLQQALREWEREPIDWDSPEPSIDAFRTGEVHRVTEVDDDWLEGRLASPRQIEIAKRLGVRSLLVVPLRSRDGTLAVWTIGSPTHKVFDAHDEALARALAERASMAIESSRLFRQATQATAARDHVLSVVSHDLRNPLSAVGMLARRLGERPVDESERGSISSNIQTSVQWMHRLMQDLLDSASIDAGRLSVEPEPREVPVIVDRAIALFASEAAARGIEVQRAVDSTLPAVLADESRVVQVLANLLGNALKFTPTGGCVSVGAERQGADVLLSVRDTGPGIPQSDIAHVFDRFWHARRTSETRGSGLGLAIAQGIVRAHGGRIWVESVPGEGSTFLFTLPVAAS